MKLLNRKNFLKGGVAAAAVALFSGLRGPALANTAPQMQSASKRKRPNILLVLTDQERSRADLPAELSLPRRDEFAATATNFTNYHGNVVACGPSRSVIYTGQHIQKTGVFDNPGMAPGRKDLDPQLTPTIGTMLKDQGYRTAYFGKWHLHGFGEKERKNIPAALARFGFDEFRPPVPEGDTDGAAWEGWKLDPLLASDTVQWLSSQSRGDKDEPWFLAVNLINPHDIRHFNATGKQGEEMHPHFASDLADIPDSKLYQTDLGYALPKSFPGADSRPVSAHQLYLEDEKYFFGTIPHDNSEAWRQYQNYYYNCLRDVDQHIGTILDGLESAGLADDTIVIFTSDHGEMAGAHGLRGKGPFLYKENFRLPLLIRHPDLQSGVSTDALACSLDLVPTILAAAGVDRGQIQEDYPQLKGKNLLADDDEGESREAILFMSNIVHCCNPDNKQHIIETLYARDRGEQVEPFRFPQDFITFENRSFLRGLYDGRYKFGRYFRPNQHHQPSDWKTLTRYNDLELYDTELDPDEMLNLAEDVAYRDLLMTLNGKLNRLLKTEAGKDDGSLMPGAPSSWKLNSPQGLF